MQNQSRPTQPKPKTFVLHCCHEHNEWRIQLNDVHGQTRHGFTELEELWHFLREQLTRVEKKS